MRRALLLAVAATAVGACSDGADTTGAGVRLTEIGRFDSPSAMAARPGSDELWVAERGGVVRVVGGDVALDIEDDVRPVEGERGLLGIAFSEAGDRLYLGFTEVVGDVRLDEWVVAADGTVDEASRRSLVDVEHREFANHNGGHVALGPDGALWFGVGDGGGAGDPSGNAQDPGVQLGKLLRVDPAAGEVTVAAIGLRNPWRFSFDRETGDLWLGDVGQNRWEEIDRVPLDELVGANFGWDRFEGSHPFEGDGPLEGAVEPVFEYEQSEELGCSVTGGFRYRGDAIDALEGAYVYGDFCGGQVRALRVADDGSVESEAALGLGVGSLVSFAEDGDGELYVLSLDGPVYRIDPS